MLLEKLQEHKNFTAHEKDVAEYILFRSDFGTVGRRTGESVLHE